MAMDRQRVRERLPDREQRKHDYDWNEARFVRWEKEKELFDNAPRVVKYDTVPWEQVHQAYHKIFTGDNLPDLDRKLKRAPIFTMSARLQVIETGRKSGNHRHYAEALFFILEGKGHEVHDGQRHDWAPGDMMIVPPYCVHQHFCDEGPATIFYVVGGFYGEMGIGGVEQRELHADFQLPEGAKQLYDPRGNLVGYRRADGFDVVLEKFAVGKEQMAHRAIDEAPTVEANDKYDYYLRLYQEENHWRQTIPQIVSQSEMPWEDTRNGRIKWLTHPQLNTGLKTYECYLQEIPPGGRSAKHHHVAEEIHFIIEGEGYEEIDGQRHEWGRNDVVAIPRVSTHVSVNTGTEPVQMLVVKSLLYDFMSFGGIEHFEDASDGSDAAAASENGQNGTAH